MNHQDSDKDMGMEMQDSLRRWESGLATLCLLYALAAFILAWGSISVQQPLWLLPGLYLLEMLGLPAMVMMLVIMTHPARMRFAALSSGATVVFAVLGMFSIGMLYLPLGLGLGVVAWLGQRTSAEQGWTLVGYLLLGAVGQGAFMFILIQLVS